MRTVGSSKCLKKIARASFSSAASPFVVSNPRVVEERGAIMRPGLVCVSLAAAYTTEKPETRCPRLSFWSRPCNRVVENGGAFVTRWKPRAIRLCPAKNTRRPGSIRDSSVTVSGNRVAIVEDTIPYAPKYVNVLIDL